MTRVASIDIGTVTVRLAVADVEGNDVARLAKQSRICDLGEGLSATGRLSDDARARVLAAVDDYLDAARKAGAAAVCCTLTSAARDASNSDVLLGSLADRGLAPEVIAGQVEGSLTFLGVARDFVGERIVVADNGGGSTELAVGSLGPDGRLDVEFVRSANVGCRRVTEKYLQRRDPPSTEDLEAAARFCRDGIGECVPWAAGSAVAGDVPVEKPARLVCVGGTVTSIVAIDAALEPYDSSFVHLHELACTDVESVRDMLAQLTVGERAHVVGLQPKRAGVILGGAVAVRELMRATGFECLTVSESDLLFGLSVVAAAAVAGGDSPVGWLPTMAPLA